MINPMLRRPAHFSKGEGARSGGGIACCRAYRIMRFDTSVQKPIPDPRTSIRPAGYTFQKPRPAPGSYQGTAAGRREAEILELVACRGQAVIARRTRRTAQERHFCSTATAKAFGAARISVSFLRVTCAPRQVVIDIDRMTHFPNLSRLMRPGVEAWRLRWLAPHVQPRSNPFNHNPNT